MKKAFLIWIFCLNLSIAQVNGISGSKLCIPDAGAISIGTVEFEPAISSFSSNKFFSKDGNIERQSLKKINSDLTIRVSAGLFDNFELGSSFSTNLDEINFGSKFIFQKSETNSFGLISGLAIPAGNESEADSEKVVSDSRFSLGFLNSYRFSDAFSIDAILSLTNNLNGRNTSPLINYGIGIGDWITDRFQIVAELNGYNCFSANDSYSKISLSSGFTYKVNKILLFVLGSQFDMKGSNTDKS